jgi:hypothetical protein
VTSAVAAIKSSSAFMTITSGLDGTPWARLVKLVGCARDRVVGPTSPRRPR